VTIPESTTGGGVVVVVDVVVVDVVVVEVVVDVVVDVVVVEVDVVLDEVVVVASGGVSGAHAAATKATIRTIGTVRRMHPSCARTMPKCATTRPSGVDQRSVLGAIAVDRCHRQHRERARMIPRNRERRRSADIAGLCVSEQRDPPRFRQWGRSPRAPRTQARDSAESSTSFSAPFWKELPSLSDGNSRKEP
jgi:hypothetical protein